VTPGMIRFCIATCLLIAAAGCASETVVRPGGPAEHMVSCWYLGWYICYDKAREICGGDFKIVSHDEGSSGRKLRVTCGKPSPVSLRRLRAYV
jgi:hypothetical protein